jgi:DNA/RNA endonuclease G (NUC1)
MKKLSLIAFLLIASLGLMAQQQVIVYPGYTSYWNATTKIPDSVIYIAKAHTKVAQRLPNFHPTGGRLNEDRDYHKSGYDQGHLCNASDENGNAIDEYNSFDQANLFPQCAKLNRTTWLAEETNVRTEAKTAPVKVKVSWHGIKGYMGVDKIVIPQWCDKETWCSNGIHEKYSMPNEDTVIRHPFPYYKIK